MDTHDWDGFEAVFTKDASFNIRGQIMTAAEWCAMVRDFLEHGLSLHQGHTPQLEIVAPGRARGIWTLTDYLEWPEQDPRRAVRGYGHYEEEYHLEDGVWLISSLRLSYLRFDTLSGPSPAAGDLRLFELGDWFDGWSFTHDRTEDAARIHQLRAVDDLRRASPVGTTHSHMPEVRFRGTDRARAIWSQHRHRHIDGDRYVDAYGYLTEEYLRVGAAWRITDSSWFASRDDLLAGDCYAGPVVPDRDRQDPSH
jgi:hypothetical protein